GIIRDKNYTTVTKTRILAGLPHTWRQQVVRLDREPETELDLHDRRELALAAKQYTQASDALLVSDYGYRAASPGILNPAKDKTTIPCVCYPRTRRLRLTGIPADTSNEPEIEEAVGTPIRDWDDLCSAGAQVLSRMKLQSLIVTRGRDGMVAFSEK